MTINGEGVVLVKMWQEEFYLPIPLANALEKTSKLPFSLYERGEHDREIQRVFSQVLKYREQHPESVIVKTPDNIIY